MKIKALDLDGAIAIALRQDKESVTVTALSCSEFGIIGYDILRISQDGIQLVEGHGEADIRIPTDGFGRVKVIGYTPDDELPKRPEHSPELQRLVEAAETLRRLYEDLYRDKFGAGPYTGDYAVYNTALGAFREKWGE